MPQSLVTGRTPGAALAVNRNLPTSVGTLASGGSLGSRGRVWDAVTGQKPFSLSGHVGSINSLVYSPDGTRIATGSVDGMVKLWDATTGRELLTLTRQKAEVKGVAFSPDGR